MKKFFSLVLALAMALSMASFASAEETTTIHIGVIGPMTGAAAVYGLAVARGAEIAVEEINAAGKVNIVLDVQDDENDAEKSINAYNATLDKGTQVILGCVTTTPCIAVSAQAYDERVFMLTPSASSLEVIANKDNMYQICFTDPAQGSASAEYIFNKKVGEKVAIVSNKAQTTRNRICGVVNRGDTQFVLMDTPGLHKARSRLGDYMVKEHEAPVGYVNSLWSEKVTVVMDETVERSVTNIPMQGQVRIVKTDAETGGSLAGAVFTVIRVSGLPSHGKEGCGEVVAVITTDAEGVAVTPVLTWGIYEIRETTVPDGYLDSGCVVTVSIPGNAD